MPQLDPLELALLMTLAFAFGGALTWLLVGHARHDERLANRATPQGVNLWTIQQSLNLIQSEILKMSANLTALQGAAQQLSTDAGTLAAGSVALTTNVAQTQSLFTNVAADDAALPPISAQIAAADQAVQQAVTAIAAANTALAALQPVAQQAK